MATVLSGLKENKESADAYQLLDFITGKHINTNNFNRILELVKNYILLEYPKLKIFCENDKNILQSKIETFIYLTK